MTTGTVVRTTAVGVFHDRDHAQAAVNELRQNGFREEDIGVAYRGEDHLHGSHEVTDRGSHAAEGAGVGAATGAGIGALWGLGVIAGVLPAIGPAIAGGTLAAILSSAAAGAAAAGLAGALVGLGLPEDEAEYYEGEFKSGRIVVTVRAESRYDDAAAVLRRHGGYDMHNRDVRPTTTTEDLARRHPR
jgi:hypothetical protein